MDTAPPGGVPLPAYRPSATTRATLLFVATFTVMSGAVVAMSMPPMRAEYAAVPGIELLSRMMLTLPALFIAISAPFAGWLIDKFGRKKLLLITMALYAVAGTSGYYLDNLFALLAGRALQGIAVAGMMTTVTTLVADYFPPGTARSRFVGTQGAFMALGGMIYIPLGGYLAEVHWRLPFLLYLIVVPAIPMALAWLPDVNKLLGLKPNPSNPDQPSPNPALDKPKPVAVPRTIYGVYAVAMFAQITFFMLPVQVPFLLESLPGVTRGQGGVAIAVTTLFAAVASFGYQYARRWMGFGHVYAFSFTLMAVGFLVIGLSDTYTVLTVGMAIAGLGAGMTSPNHSVWVMELAPPHLRGRLMGGVASAIFMGQFLSPILTQPVAAYTTLNNAFVVSAALLAAMGLGFLLFWRR